MISPLIAAEDFARQLPLDEFESFTDSTAATRRVALCYVVINGVLALRANLGDARVELFKRELTTLIRRVLRSSDAVTLRGDDLLLLLDVPAVASVAVVERVLNAVRSHIFSAGALGQPIRVTLSIGIASSPEHGASSLALGASARKAAALAGEDGVATAFAPEEEGLNLGRAMGRGDRLASLIDAFDRAMRGAGHVIAVIGEPGVGASTLVRMVEPEVRLRGGSLVTGTCYPQRLPSPYALWSDILRAVRRLPVKTTRQWQQLPLLDGNLERDVSVSPGSGKTRLLEELTDFFRLAAQQRPLVLVLEDMQWSDDASWDALEYLITQLERERILIVLTMQGSTAGDVVLDRWNRIATRQRHTEIRLSHLTRDDVKRWLEATLQTSDVSREFMSFVYRQSDGRSLLLTHLMRDLEESGHLVSDGAAWHTSSAHELPPIASFDDLFGRRLARLGPGPRELLEVAAVLVRDGDETFLAGDGAARRRGDIRVLVEGGFLRPTFDRARAAYVVAHSEIARVVRSRLDPARLEEVNRRVARGLASEPGAHRSAVAEHFEAAGNRVLAHRYALEAADHAANLHETAAVLTLLAAAEGTAPSEDALADVRVRMVTMAEEAGRLEEAEQYCDRVLPWLEAHGERSKALRLKSQRVRLRMQRGQAASDTLEMLFALELEAQEVGADAERAEILLLISQTHWRLGDIRAARRVAAECVEIAERGFDNVLISDACNRLGVAIMLDDPEQARGLFNRSRDAATAAGDASRLVRVLNNIGLLELHSYNWNEARRMLSLGAEQARTAGLLYHWARAELNLGVLAGRIGDYETAERSLSEALRLSSVMQNSEDQVYATYNLAQVEFETLRLQQAADTYELVINLSGRIEQVEVQAGAYGGLGLCNFLMGDYEGARAACAQAMPLVDRLDEWFQGREFVEALKIHLALLEGDKAGAAGVLSSALQSAGSKDAYAPAWLSAEFGKELFALLPDEAKRALTAHAEHPEVLAKPALCAKLAELKLYSTTGVDE